MFDVISYIEAIVPVYINEVTDVLALNQQKLVGIIFALAISEMLIRR